MKINFVNTTEDLNIGAGVEDVEFFLQTAPKNSFVNCQAYSSNALLKLTETY